LPALTPLSRRELSADYVDSKIHSWEIEKLAALRRDEPRVTILLAEDESSLRQMLGHVLQSAGYHLMIAEDGRRAVQLAKKHDGRIDLLLSDIEMPGLTGPDLAQELLRTRPNLRVMLMSGCMSALGVFEKEWRFLQKPFAPIRLLQEIQIALQ
jgi:two-component system, cell cycle sensor histidine kinase and response regulator CckA